MCERAIDELRELSNSRSFDLEILDITKDRTLFERYFLKIPVVRINGKDVLEVEQIAGPTDCKRNLEALVMNLS